MIALRLNGDELVIPDVITITRQSSIQVIRMALEHLIAKQGWVIAWAMGNSESVSITYARPGNPLRIAIIYSDKSINFYDSTYLKGDPLAQLIVLLINILSSFNFFPTFTYLEA